MFIDQLHSNRTKCRSQSAAGKRFMIGWALLWALAGVGTGCSSIYHETRNLLPPGSEEIQQMRMDEARAAEIEVHRAGAKLRDRLNDETQTATMEIALARLEVAIRNLERRLAAAGAVLEDSSSTLAAEHARLQSEYVEWKVYLDQRTQEIPHVVQRQQLDVLLLETLAP